MAENTEKPKLGRFALYWLFGLLGLLVCQQILSQFITATELEPSHGDAIMLGFACGLLTGVISAGVGFRYSNKFVMWRRISCAFGYFLLGAIVVSVLCNTVAELIENAVDFPAEKTQSYTVNLQIARAYHTTGKNPSWVIQPLPIWGNIDITKDDFTFMQQHRRPGDPGKDPDEISSKGWFCAHVTMQVAGEAVRVMNAGSHPLPKGTVILCPSGMRNGD